MLNRPEEYQRMAEAESRLWWYRALHHLVARALARHPNRRQIRIVDAGCGTGGLLMFLREHGYLNLSGFDVSPEAVAICKQRGLPVQSGDLRQLDQMPMPRLADAIISNDTLYFFSSEEREQILKLCGQTLAPNGLLILNLPALRVFRGIHDVSVGIAHRFSKPEVQTLISSAGLSLEQMFYWPLFFSPFIYLIRLTQRIRLQRSRHVQVRSDIRLPPAPINCMMAMVARVENAVLPWKPFGSSLFVVAKKLP